VAASAEIEERLAEMLVRKWSGRNTTIE